MASVRPEHAGRRSSLRWSVMAIVGFNPIEVRKRLLKKSCYINPAMKSSVLPWEGGARTLYA